MIINEMVNNSWTSNLVCKDGSNILDQVYTFKIEVNRDNNTATLVTGYQGTEDFDSYFVLSKDDLVKLGDIIKDSLLKFDIYKEMIDRSNTSMEEINKFLESNSIKEIHIKYDSLVGCGPYESLFGYVVVDVQVLTDDTDITFNDILLTDKDLFQDDISKLSVFSMLPDTVKFIVDNPDDLKQFRETITNEDMSISKDISMPKAIEKEDIEAIKNKILADIDEKYNK